MVQVEQVGGQGGIVERLPLQVGVEVLEGAAVEDPRVGSQRGKGESFAFLTGAGGNCGSHLVKVSRA